MTELYINGRRMDLDSATVIARTFQQNLITSQGSVDSPYTNSFSLPYTKTNAEVLGSPEEATSLTQTPYLKLDCVIRQDGIEQFPNSIAEVQGFEDGRYTVQVFAGAVPFFDLLGDSNIQDLDFSAYRHIWNYANVVAGLQGVGGVYIYDLIDRGKVMSTSYLHPSYLMPSVFGKAIWDKIFAERGIVYNMEPNTDFEALTLPFSNDIPVHSQEYMEANTQTFDLTEKPGGEVLQPKNTNWIFGNPYARVQVPGAGHYKALFKFELLSIEEGSVNPIQVSFAYLDRDRLHYAGPMTSPVYSSTTFAHPGVYEAEYVYKFEPGEDVSNYDFLIYITYNGLGTYYEYSYATVTITPEPEVIYGNEWDISLNLPDMKQKDFVLAVCKLFGWGLVYDAYTGSIAVKPLNDVALNIPLAKDWTGKLDYASKPKSAFKLPETARNNLYKWKEDETVLAGFGDGVIPASNEHLELERNAVEMPFAASEERLGLLHLPANAIKINNPPGKYDTTRDTFTDLMLINVVDEGDGQNNWPPGTRVYVKDASDDPTVRRGWVVYKADYYRFWSKEEREDDYDTNKIEPRLAYLGPHTKQITVAEGATTQTATFPVAMFAPLSFEVLIPKYYAVLQRVLSRVQMHSVPVLLTAQDFAELDSTVPVWIEGFRDYYYVNKVTDYVSETIPCEVELIKLN